MRDKDNKILIALGFDENHEAFLNRALTTAKMLNAKVYILHVITEMPRMDFYFDAYRLWENFRDSAIKESMEMLNGLIGKYSDEYPGIESMVEVGEPIIKVLDKADELDVDLIIMGHHVRKGLTHMLHLNTCEHVVRLSKRPVLTFYIEE